MRLKVSLNESLLMTTEQLEKLVAVLDGVESVQTKWDRNFNNGKGGSIEIINTSRISELVSCKPLSDIEYDALVTFSALRDDN